MQTINGFRLSPQQKYLWMLQQDSPAYRIQSAILIEGSLQTDNLKKALEKVSKRHEIIRTSFQRRPGLKIPIQVISEHSFVSWNWVNLSEVTPQEQEAKLEDIFQQEKSALFNFEGNPVWRLSLITLSSERHILLVSLPALCADSRTLKNLVRELSQCYAASLHGEELSDEVVQYVQFSEWQNELLEDEEAAEGKEYWTRQDLSALASLRLPFENRLINAPSQFTPQAFEVKLELALLKKVEAIARQYNTSLSTFLLACWKILLWRLIGQSELTVGVAFDGRKYEELEPALGLFAKFLPLSSQLTENFSFAETWQQIQQEECEAYKYQEYFSHEYLGNSSGFPFGFEFEEQLEKHSASGVFFSIDKQYACGDRFKVKLSCHRQNDSLAAEFHYDPIFLADKSIRCLAEQFYALVQSAASNPQTAIRDLEMLSDRARHQLLVEFNSTTADYQLDKCVHHLFEEQAERSPNRIAAVCENQQITYSELNARANQIAHYLQQLGIKPEVIVGICVDRSLEAIAGILGILKAGGAYLPIDPAMPKERLALMLQNARTPVLLTQQHLLKNLPETQAQIVCLDAEIPSVSPSPSPPLSPENLAYVIYTSGSTGTPKGVAIEHRQLLNYLHGIQEKLNLPPTANFATVSTFAADLGHTVIFPALCSGGCLHIISQERATDPQAIAAYFQQHSIDCLKIVPSHLKALLSDSNASQILPKKRLILGGEPLMWNLIETIQKYNPDCSIFNHYGPTETTVGVLTYQVKMQGDRISQTVPLGRPLPNTQIYLLDSHLQPVPVGVAGELYIAGAGLARGYLNQPELTAEKFLCNSLTQEPKTRLYKTGDLARYLPDGNIEFIDRVDRQVKLRGFRIELGEIEAGLSHHPSVREAVVVLQENEPGNQRLVAYIVAHSKLSLQDSQLIENLRSFLKEQLPEYMIPSAFVVLKALPLTPNGKIDPQALPAPSIAANFTDTFVGPRTPGEEILAGIWSQLLNLKKVGIHDNFFDLGGHSLLITQLLAKVRESFQVELPLRVLFEAPTVAGLAEKIEMQQGGNTAGDRPSNFDINAEAILDPVIRPETAIFEPTAEPTRILLTGATGFLGAFLLRELLLQTQAQIYCLVRSDNAESAKKRIQSSLEYYSICDEHLHYRIIPIAGDLAQPLLGLSEEQFRELASQIDVIYHNGAFVKFTYPYSVLKLSNVLGTQEILRLASQIKLKPVHFVSTISVFSSAGESGVKVVGEQDELTPGEVLKGAYPQSKWVAEKLVEIARYRGIPVSIYRPGRISGHSQTGACNSSDSLYRLLAGCVQLGCVPDGNWMMNVAPVDYVSRAIVHLSRQKESIGKNFHLVNPHSFYLSELVGWIRSSGYPIERVCYETWQAEIVNRAGNSPENALYPLVGLFSEKVSETEMSQSGTLQFDCKNTLDGLATTAITCPQADANLFRTYLSYLADCGLIGSHN
ncbi:non-ribosomal peptide synthetase [Tychonema sp. LEGE 06208]|uniref:non-ribosomal peptide synthetase family protein n=1 Tax=Tychonema sp. LEGE 06208 TaxID=1828663 RepID=UPI0018803F09|nr:non-ribosomal peptide synthetase [Tychonema sp. LEGE 06208]MBE9162159.1 amino acid adenylation domain-containing protein [Tychonema sp. LEGE 06208]